MKHFLRIGFSVFVSVIFFLICGCGKGKAAQYGVAAESTAWNQADVAYAAPMAARTMAKLSGGGSFAEAGELPMLQAAQDGAQGAAQSAGQSRKLTKNADIRLRVENPDTMEGPLAELMEKYGAWPASAGIYENSRNYSIRVPSGSYDAMLAELAGLGKILRRTENTEDVTLRYYDLESRLATQRELLITYRGYLEKAKNVEELMIVERHINDLEREIDWTGTQFRNLANLVDYATINVEISGPVTAFSPSEPSLGEKLKTLFASFGKVLSTALVVLTGIVIYGIPAILIFTALFWILFGRIGLLKKLMLLASGKRKTSNE